MVEDFQKETLKDNARSRECSLEKPPNKTMNNWHKKFDRKFYEGYGNTICCKEHKIFATPSEIKSFIAEVILAAKREGRLEALAEIAHEQKKFKDGFSHPKDCKLCLYEI